MRDTFDRDNARERERKSWRERERGRYLVQRSHRVQWTFSWLFIHAASLRKIKDLSAGVWHKNENQKLKKKLKKIKDKKKKQLKQTQCKHIARFAFKNEFHTGHGYVFFFGVNGWKALIKKNIVGLLQKLATSSGPGQNRSLCPRRSQLAYDKLAPAVKVIDICF